MRRRIPALVVVLLATLAAIGLHAPASHADLADRCRIAAHDIDLSAGGAFKPTIHFQVYSCPNSNYAFHAKAWCVRSVDLGTWTQCANTTVFDVHSNGNTSWSVPVGNGSWGCSNGVYYETEAEIWDADTSSWVANIPSSRFVVC